MSSLGVAPNSLLLSVLEYGYGPFLDHMWNDETTWMERRLLKSVEDLGTALPRPIRVFLIEWKNG